MKKNEEKRYMVYYADGVEANEIISFETLDEAIDYVDKNKGKEIVCENESESNFATSKIARLYVQDRDSLVFDEDGELLEFENEELYTSPYFYADSF